MRGKEGRICARELVDLFEDHQDWHSNNANKMKLAQVYLMTGQPQKVVDVLKGIDLEAYFSTPVQKGDFTLKAVRTFEHFDSHYVPSLKAARIFDYARMIAVLSYWNAPGASDLFKEVMTHYFDQNYRLKYGCLSPYLYRELSIDELADPQVIQLASELSAHIQRTGDPRQARRFLSNVLTSVKKMRKQDSVLRPIWAGCPGISRRAIDFYTVEENEDDDTAKISLPDDEFSNSPTLLKLGVEELLAYMTKIVQEEWPPLEQYADAPWSIHNPMNQHQPWGRKGLTHSYNLLAHFRTNPEDFSTPHYQVRLADAYIITGQPKEAEQVLRGINLDGLEFFGKVCYATLTAIIAQEDLFNNIMTHHLAPYLQKGTLLPGSFSEALELSGQLKRWGSDKDAEVLLSNTVASIKASTADDPNHEDLPFHFFRMVEKAGSPARISESYLWSSQLVELPTKYLIWRLAESVQVKWSPQDVLSPLYKNWSKQQEDLRERYTALLGEQKSLMENLHKKPDNLNRILEIQQLVTDIVLNMKGPKASGEVSDERKDREKQNIKPDSLWF